MKWKVDDKLLLTIDPLGDGIRINCTDFKALEDENPGLLRLLHEISERSERSFSNQISFIITPTSERDTKKFLEEEGFTIERIEIAQRRRSGYY